MLAHFDDRPRGLDCSCHHLRKIEGAAPQIDVTVRESGDVQQILDEAGELPELALNDTARGVHSRRVRRVRSQQLDCICNRREWVAQLMQKDREEFARRATMSSNSSSRRFWVSIRVAVTSQDSSSELYAWRTGVPRSK